MPGGRSWREWSQSPGSRSPEYWTRILGPFVEPGNRFRYAFQAAPGARGTRWLATGNSTGTSARFAPIPFPLLAYALGVRSSVVAVTDNAILVLRARLTTNIPKR